VIYCTVQFFDIFITLVGLWATSKCRLRRGEGTFPGIKEIFKAYSAINIPLFSSKPVGTYQGIRVMSLHSYCLAIYVYLATSQGKALGHGLYPNRGLCWLHLTPARFQKSPWLKALLCENTKDTLDFYILFFWSNSRNKKWAFQMLAPSFKKMKCP